VENSYFKRNKERRYCNCQKKEENKTNGRRNKVLENTRPATLIVKKKRKNKKREEKNKKGRRKNRGV
jgi:hypothetical protein